MGVISPPEQASIRQCSASKRVRAWTDDGFPSRKPRAGRSGVVSPSTCGKLIRTKRRVPAARAATARLRTYSTFVTGRNRSGRGANSRPAEYTIASQPRQASSRPWVEARSPGHTSARACDVNSFGGGVRCTRRRTSWPAPSRWRAKRDPRLPAAPATRIFTTAAGCRPSFAGHEGQRADALRVVTADDRRCREVSWSLAELPGDPEVDHRAHVE